MRSSRLIDHSLRFPVDKMIGFARSRATNVPHSFTFFIHHGATDCRMLGAAPGSGLSSHEPQAIGSGSRGWNLGRYVRQRILYKPS